MEKRLRWQWRCPQSGSWRVDETYVKLVFNSISGSAEATIQ